jgi:cholesterol transport system auxiliary component
MIGLGLGLVACAVPTQRAAAPLLYDFGVRPAVAAAPATGTLPALALTVQATPVLDGSAMLYRLAYADGQQLRSYSQARWAMPPAELVLQRLREGLSNQYTVLRPGEGAQRVLQLELEEFSQVFETAERSQGELRLRATVRQRLASGERLLAQRSVVLQRPAPSADAAGGVRALSAATDAAVLELAQWLQTVR